MTSEIPLDTVINNSLSITSFENVTNTKELQESVKSGRLQCAILKRALILDPFQIVVAANKAAIAEKFNHLTTKSKYTEILFNLSVSKNITQSLACFGVDDRDENIIVVTFGKCDEILTQINGTKADLYSQKYVDSKKIMALYKISDEELKVGSLIDSIVSRIAAKDC